MYADQIREALGIVSLIKELQNSGVEETDRKEITAELTIALRDKIKCSGGLEPAP